MAAESHMVSDQNRMAYSLDNAQSILLCGSAIQIAGLFLWPDLQACGPDQLVPHGDAATQCSSVGLAEDLQDCGHSQPGLNSAPRSRSARTRQPI